MCECVDSVFVSATESDVCTYALALHATATHPTQPASKRSTNTRTMEYAPSPALDDLIGDGHEHERGKNPYPAHEVELIASALIQRAGDDAPRAEWPNEVFRHPMRKCHIRVRSGGTRRCGYGSSALSRLERDPVDSREMSGRESGTGERTSARNNFDEKTRHREGIRAKRKEGDDMRRGNTQERPYM